MPRIGWSSEPRGAVLPHELPSVTLLLLERGRPASQRHRDAWGESLAAYPGGGQVHRVWTGSRTAPPGVELGSLGAAQDVLGLDGDDLVIVAEAVATPAPRLLERLVHEVVAGNDAIVDASVLPVELTRVDDRPRGYYLEDDADRDAEVLKETRYPVLDGEDPTHDDDGDESVDLPDTAAATPGRPLEQRPGDSSASDGVSDNELLSQDGTFVRPRATGACCALRARHLGPMERALSAAPDEGSGAALLRAAAERDLDVTVAAIAAVALPVVLDWDARMVDLVLDRPEQVVDWSEDTHPALLPATALGSVFTRINMLPAGDLRSTHAPGAPFLTVVTRTQGRRMHCLEDMFTCLAAQTDRDFEVLLMAHRVDDQHLEALRELVATLPSWLQDVVRVIPVERPGRAAPLNEGFSAARGRYIVALDDDDTVLSHYVATFKAGAAVRDGQLIRAACARQDVAPVGDLDTLCAVSVDDVFRDWPMDFALFDHVTANHSPFMSIAFPRGVFHDLGMRFDETLDTTEDWDYIVRCASVVGVSSAREITCVYRWWVHTGSSREVHTKAEWDEARLRVQRRTEQAVLLLPPGETLRLVESLNSTQRAARKAHRLAREFATSQHHTNLRMIETAKSHSVAVRKRDVAERRVEKLRAELKEARQRLRRQSKRLRRLEARLTIEERVRVGTLRAPSSALSELTDDQLAELAASPETRQRWPRLRRG